jgi:hypothetical protein
MQRVEGTNLEVALQLLHRFALTEVLEKAVKRHLVFRVVGALDQRHIATS